MRVILVVGLLLASASTAAVSAQTPNTARTVVTLTPGDPGEKIICKKNKDNETGSNLRRRPRICMTANAWRDLETINEEAKRRMADRASLASDPAGGAAGPN